MIGVSFSFHRSGIDNIPFGQFFGPDPAVEHISQHLFLPSDDVSGHLERWGTISVHMKSWIVKYPLEKCSGRAFDKYSLKNKMEYDNRKPEPGDYIFFCATKPKPHVTDLRRVQSIEADQSSKNIGSWWIHWTDIPLKQTISFDEIRKHPLLKESKFLRTRALNESESLSNQEADVLIKIVRKHNPRVPASVSEAELERDIKAEFPEGGRVQKTHLIIERNRSNIVRKRKAVLEAKGSLACQICGFDFRKNYDLPSGDFCEVHHSKQLSNRKVPAKTPLEDLAVLCANCHRAIHLFKPLPTIEQFKKRFFKGR